MAVSEAQKKATLKYLEKFDEIKIRVPRGTKEQWKHAASIRGKSLNQLVLDAMEKEIQQDNAECGNAEE